MYNIGNIIYLFGTEKRVETLQDAKLFENFAYHL